MSRESYLVQVPADVVKDETIYYDNLFAWAVKIKNLSACRDIDSERIYVLDGKYYALVEATASCIQMIVENGYVSEDGVISQDVLSEILQENGWKQIPKENIYDFSGEKTKQISSGMCLIC